MKKINLSIIIALAIISLCTISSKAMSPDESTSPDYLKTHGYSQEMVRLVNVQKGRIEQKETVTEEKSTWYNKPVKTLKHWYNASDCTMSPDFGNDKIKF